MNPKQMQKMLRQAQEMQQRMEEEMGQMAVEGSSGGGMVTVVIDGKKNLKSVTIKPEAVDPDDVEMLQDMIVAAVQDASRKADESLSSQLGGLTGGLMGGM